MKKKIVALALVFCLALAIGVGGTLAYLTSTTGPVTNTFTVGNVSFVTNAGLDEAKVNEYGEMLKKVTNSETGKVSYEVTTNAAEADRVTGNTYKLVPGHTYVKDPTVHIGADSENAWLFVKINNGIEDIENATTIHNQMTSGTSAKWEVVDATDGIYAYKVQVKANDNIQVFESFTLGTDAVVANYTKAEITVRAGLIQADGFDTYTAAWNANSKLFDSTAETGTEK